MNNEKEPDMLYHYCSLSTFESIIRNKTLRLSDITKSNDSEELTCIKELTENIFIKTLEESFTSSKQELRDIQQSKLWKGIVDEYVTNWFNMEERHFFYYVICFSEEGDLLSQWRGYADDGRGVCIGIDKGELKKIVNTEKENIGLYKVIYSKKEQEHRINSIANSMTSGIRKTRNNQQCLEMAFGKIFDLAPKCKMSFFKEEKEYRICYKADRQTVINKGRNERNTYYIGGEDDTFINKVNTISYLSPIQFTVSDGKLTSYADLCFQSRQFKKIAPIIKKITIGPKSRISKDDIKIMMIHNGFDIGDIEITESVGTYR